MARRDRLEEVLSKLAVVRREPTSDGSLAELRRVLAREGSHAVARAASIVGEAGLDALAEDLESAFIRLLEGGAASDKGCAAKTAIAEALHRLDVDAERVYRAGLGHVQIEPVFGGRVDTAAGLRSACALGLAGSGAGDVLLLLAERLADPEPAVRVAVARAIGAHGRSAGVPLLRYKTVVGDEEARVVTEALLALLHLDPGSAFPFAAGLLEPDEAGGRDRSACAALALGESRLAEAFPVLRAWCDKAVGVRRARTAVTALASLRREEAFDHLLSLVREGETTLACEAAAVLAEQANEALRARLRQAASGRGAVEAVVARALEVR